MPESSGALGDEDDNIPNIRSVFRKQNHIPWREIIERAKGYFITAVIWEHKEFFNYVKIWSSCILYNGSMVLEASYFKRFFWQFKQLVKTIVDIQYLPQFRQRFKYNAEWTILGVLWY